MPDKPDLVTLSQTAYARNLRRDLANLDGFASFQIRRAKMPANVDFFDDVIPRILYPIVGMLAVAFVIARIIVR